MDRQSITAEEAIDQVYQFGGRVLGKDISDVTAQADRVKSIFGKVRKLSGYMKDIANVLSLLKDYMNGVYVQVPWRIVAALTGTLFYVFSPVDLIPDLIPMFGFADDATVFAAVMSFAQVDVAAYLAWKAERGEAIEGGGKSGILSIEKSDDITNWSLTDFVQVVQNALAAIGNSGLRWFYGEQYVSQNAANIVGKIMGGNGSISDVIGGIDMEAFQHCKEGFAFTRDMLYFRQFMGDSFSFKWRDIMSIQYEGKELIINGVRLNNMCHDEDDAKMVCKVLLAMANRADLTPEPEPYDASRYVPINEAIVKRFSNVDNGGLLFVGDNIPEKKRMGAHKAMNIQEPPEDICLVFDNSIFGTGKSGFALTSKAMYCKETFSDPARREWGCYKWVANPTSFWLMFVNNQPYYEISGSTLNANQISSIVDALNEFQMYHLNETGRSIEAKCKSVLEQIEVCEKAAALDAEAEDTKNLIQNTAATSEVINCVNDEMMSKGIRKTTSTKKNARKAKLCEVPVDGVAKNGNVKAKDVDVQGKKANAASKGVALHTKKPQGKAVVESASAKNPRKSAAKSASAAVTGKIDALASEKARITTSDKAVTSNRSSGKPSDKKVASVKAADVEKGGEIDKTHRKARRTVKNAAKTGKKITSPQSNSLPSEKVSLESAVKTAVAKSGARSNVFVGPNIPTKKLNNAIASMGVRVGEDVYALIDTTIFGSAKSGLVFTSLGIRWRNDWMQTDTVKTALTWSEVDKVIASAKVADNDLVFATDTIVSLAGSGIDPKDLKSILQHVVELAV